jgi:hypothetical protein
VAVGFVDLGILLAADLEAGSKPLRFIGIERSTYAVAKTNVIWELLKHTPSSGLERKQYLHSIIQVWFSSAWSFATLKAVRAALTRLCIMEKSFHPEVRRLLEHWLNAPTFSLKNPIRSMPRPVRTAVLQYVAWDRSTIESQ